MDWKFDGYQWWVVHKNGNYAYLHKDKDGYVYTVYVINGEDRIVQNLVAYDDLEKTQACAEKVLENG